MTESKWLASTDLAWIPLGVSWSVLYKQGSVLMRVYCRDRAEAERLAAETNAIHPGLGAWADWYFPTRRGD